MLPKLIPRIVVSLFYLIMTSGYSQMAKTINTLPKVEWSGLLMNSKLSDEEKVSMLSLLPEGDSVQFELPNYNPDEYPDDPRYFGLSISGLHYFDLDSDGDLDLVYSGQSGWNMLTDAKIYYNNNNKLQYRRTIRGGILDIQKNDNGYSVYTLWVPCCDSYTTIIQKHFLSSDVSSSFQYSILVIGLRSLRGLPNFDDMKSATINEVSLFAFPDDFRGTSPYFRDRDRMVNDSLRRGYHINLISLKGKIKINVLDQKTVKEETWYLIITEPILNVPKSLYEWTSRSRPLRLVGWVKELSFE